MQPSLWKSRKFALAMLDVAVCLITYFVGKYAAPELSKDILFVLGVLQAPFALVIASITVQNVEGIRAEAAKYEVDKISASR